MTDPQPWQHAVRRLAKKRAKAEARRRYGIQKGAQIPFSYRWNHVQAVVGMALHLAADTGADGEIVEAAAWLHDACKGAGDHALAGAEKARRFLPETDFPSEKIETVAVAIAQHEGLYRPVDASPLEPLAAAVLWDADKLTKLGVSALAFNLRAPYGLGSSLAASRLDIAEFTHSVLSRTVASMNTAPGRRIAERRYAEMCRALAIWAEEEEEMSNE